MRDNDFSDAAFNEGVVLRRMSFVVDEFANNSDWVGGSRILLNSAMRGLAVAALVATVR